MLYEKLTRLGLDVESIAIGSYSVKSGLSPEEEAEARLELTERYLREGESLIDKDVVRACEKLYKSAEEAIEALAIVKGLSEADEAGKRGRNIKL